ncbi:MAG TPA: hypothetical protein VGZ47_16830 [Gemmataceae bacterium]|jgi:hypothetical protein|nr:hypothetical protein [Gemmataceae bacterium]
MGLEFLQQYGGRRLQIYTPQAPPEDEAAADEEPEHAPPRRDLERAEPDWRPIDIGSDLPAPEEMPCRFIDGCYHGENVAWAQSPEGFPIPIRLAEIGGVCIRAEDRTLRREFAITERVVASIFDPFPWDDVESFAAALTAERFQCLPTRPHREVTENGEELGTRKLSFDFRRNSEAVRIGVLHEMAALEELALCHDREVPVVVDGRIGKYQRCGLDGWDVIGVIKRHAGEYLHPQGYRALLALQPGQRTPIFELPSKHLDVISWYLKLEGGAGSMPDWGYVRMEISRDCFERHQSDFEYINRLSNGILRIRCRQDSYGRSPVSLEPIVRAEDSLKSLFQPMNPLIHHFYRLTKL